MLSFLYKKKRQFSFSTYNKLRAFLDFESKHKRRVAWLSEKVSKPKKVLSVEL